MGRGLPQLDIKYTLKTLYEDCLTGRMHLWVYRGLYDELVPLHARRNVYEATPAFFTVTIKAHVNEAIRLLDRLLDKRRGAVGIEYLLKLIERSNPQNIDKELSNIIATARTKLKVHSGAIEKLRTHRNKIFVHVDPQAIANPQQLQLSTDFTLGDLERLYEILIDTLVELGEIFFKVSWAKETTDWKDFEHLIRLSEMGKCAWVEGAEYPTDGHPFSLRK